MRDVSRRDVLRAGAGLAAAAWAVGGLDRLGLPGVDRARAFVPSDTPTGPRPPQDRSVEVLHPMNRVPLSFIIDDSTCLVNMGHFCMPQFAAAWPQRPEYKRPWREWPREIPDAFVRDFGEWCAQSGVRGKYSLVPYPACVGWLDRDLPGWTKRELQDSLKLVRDLMLPNWDVHPEMITHTRVIDLKTGRPLEPMSSATMENSYPPRKQSADELAAYIAYALRILKNCDIPCDGATTPGGFGNIDKAALSLAMRQAATDVFAPEIPHYFKYIADGAEPTHPRLEHVEGLDTEDPKLVVNVPAGTGDWFGGWDGDRPSFGDKYANADATSGRMVELIERNQPAVMFCHWAGLYSCGNRSGFEAFKKIVTALNARYRDRTIWMKTSEMARYWAAKELTKIERTENELTLTAPFASPRYTLRVQRPAGAGGEPKLTSQGKQIPLAEVTAAPALKPGTWMKEEAGTIVCFDLPKGVTKLAIG